MIITHRSVHRYPRANKILASSLPKDKSFDTFYSKGKTEKNYSEAYGGENRPASIKEFIDVYFDEETKKASNRMPIIKRRQHFLQTGRIGDCTEKNTSKEEQLSKYVSHDDHPPFFGPLPPPPLKKQGGVQKIISKILKNEIETSQQNQKLFCMMIRMVQPDLRKRKYLDQVIESL